MIVNLLFIFPGLTQDCLNLLTYFKYKSTPFYKVQVCGASSFCRSVKCSCWTFQCIRLLGSLRDTILLQCVHAQGCVHRIQSLPQSSRHARAHQSRSTDCTSVRISQSRRSIDQGARCSATLTDACRHGLTIIFNPAVINGSTFAKSYVELDY